MGDGGCLYLRQTWSPCTLLRGARALVAGAGRSPGRRQRRVSARRVALLPRGEPLGRAPSGHSGRRAPGFHTMLAHGLRERAPGAWECCRGRGRETRAALEPPVRRDRWAHGCRLSARARLHLRRPTVTSSVLGGVGGARRVDRTGGAAMAHCRSSARRRGHSQAGRRARRERRTRLQRKRVERVVHL